MEIIGVTHCGNNLRNEVIKHIEKNHPNLESLMLELTPGMEVMPSGWFEDMAEHFDKKGTRIIKGDIGRLKLYGCNTAEELTDLMENHTLKFIGKELHLISKIGAHLMLPWKTRFLEIRDGEMNKVYEEEKPEVVVVGGMHANYLKQKNPEVHYTFFGEENIIERLFCSNGIRADKKHFVDNNPFIPSNEKKYLKDLAFVTAYTALGTLFFGGGVASDFVVALNLVGITNRFRGAAYYFTAVKEKVKYKLGI